MLIESVFEYQQPIPAKYTGDGQDVSPPLRFEQIPEGTKSLVLIMDDPDAPHGTFDHWIVWNISPHVHAISEGAPELKKDLVKQGRNGFGTDHYKGPKPPPGRPHRYFFKLYALNISKIELPDGANKQQIEEAMQGHVLDQAELMGTYQR